MKILTTAIEGVLVLEPPVYGDERGYFLETWHDPRYRELGIVGPFVQDNESLSRRGVLRGLHYQLHHPQGKLVRVVLGEVFDVAVDIRRGSPTFGRWVGTRLDGGSKRQVWIPPGMAHGFCVLSETAIFSYKCTELYLPEDERGVLWNDPEIGIEWPLDEPMLSGKDRLFPPLAEAELPEYRG